MCECQRPQGNEANARPYKPLTRFEDLTFVGQLTFVNDEGHERASNSQLSVRMQAFQAEGERYRVVAKIAREDRTIRDFKLAPRESVELVLHYRVGERGALFLCESTRNIGFASLPFGERSPTPAPIGVTRQWQLEGEVEMTNDVSAALDETYTTRLTVERRGPDFYIRLVEIWLPRDACERWFEQCVRAERQLFSGVALPTQ
jgi:hypothetical protein